MRTLYISDLDGTLLQPDVTISDFTKRTLNSLIASGMYFSVATARTAATAVHILEGVNINIPVVLMNGVCTYDIAARCYTEVNALSAQAKRILLDIIKANGLSGFIYTIDGGMLQTFYENTDTPNAVRFIEERVKRFGKKFTKVSDFGQCIDKNIVYYSISDKKEKLQATAQEIGRYSEILHYEFYSDNYNEEYYYLEISSPAASKFNAVRQLRAKYGFDKIVGFGDNINDLPLFEACDKAYAVENALPQVKERAAGVIGENTADGVARWLAENQHIM